MEREISTKFRLLADFLDAHPELPEPLFPLMIYSYTKAEMLAAAKIRGARKVYNGQYFYINVPLSDNVRINFFTDRQVVCTAIKTEMVTEPAREARTFEKVVEWDCHPLLQPDEENL